VMVKETETGGSRLNHSIRVSWSRGKDKFGKSQSDDLLATQ